MPSNPTARRLIKLAGRPVAAPSANLSGRPSPTTADDVLEDMDGRIDAVIMGEMCDVGIESTVLDMTGGAPVILRPGILSKEYLSDVLGKEVVYDPSLLEVPEVIADPDQGAVDTLFRPRSPGMKYKHYAPDADVILIEGSEERFRMRARELGLEAMKEGKRAAIIDYGDDPNRAAHKFFADLRELDRQGYDLILIRSLEQKGKGFSVMNRMLKSAGYDVE
jgi:L-threonylcarbamoyladenylate synthase